MEPRDPATRKKHFPSVVFIMEDVFDKQGCGVFRKTPQPDCYLPGKSEKQEIQDRP